MKLFFKNHKKKLVIPGIGLLFVGLVSLTNPICSYYFPEPTAATTCKTLAATALTYLQNFFKGNDNDDSQ
jgi:uncharacterized membrane-anchored protein